MSVSEKEAKSEMIKLVESVRPFLRSYFSTLMEKWLASDELISVFLYGSKKYILDNLSEAVNVIIAITT